MKLTQLWPGLWSVSMEDRDLRTFRSASYTEVGMSYTSYLLETEAGWITLGALPQRYASQWADTIREKTAEKGVTHAVFFGVDGDRGCWNEVKARFPGAVLVGGEKVCYDLKDEGDQTLLIRAKRDLTLGGKTLEFHVLAGRGETPALAVLDRENGILITADCFGADCAAGAPRVSELTDRSLWLRGAELYYADIFGGKRSKAMKQNVDFVEENGVRMICPAFGPVVDTGLEELLHIYRRSAPAKGEKLTLALAYVPENYLGQLAKEIAVGAAESGDLRVLSLDLSAVSREEAIAELNRADAILWGVPDRDCKPVWDVLTSLDREGCKDTLAAVFHSAGLDSPIPAGLRSHLALLGANLNTKDFFPLGKPTGQDLKNAADYGFSIGCLLQGIPNPRQPSLVKCLVCGEIFDASLGVCPVCGVGLDQCVPVDADAVSFKNDTDRKYLIVGGGIAAISAAEAIRRRDGTGEITLLSAEDYLPINRPMLTKDLVTASTAPESLAVHDAGWYAERGITLKLGMTVTGLDPEKKEASTDKGERFYYDKLVWAAGAECFVPPFRGRDKPGVITIRHLWDSAELTRRMAGAKSAVVIGGGVLGLEAASELMRAGIKVTVLEATPQIVGRQVDRTTADKLKEFMSGLGVECLEGVSIQEITGGDEADGVLLADGRHFPADFVLVSCGNRANLGPMKEAGATIDRAIVVNARMETSLPDVYACGDCCQFDGVNFQLWQEASDQGRTAGANAAGEETLYRHQMLGLSMEGFGTSLYALGDPGKREGVPYKTVRITDEVRNKSETYWFFGGALAGAVVIGSPEKTGDITQAVTTQKRYEELF